MIVEGQDGLVKDTDLLQVGQLGCHDEVKCRFSESGPDPWFQVRGSQGSSGYGPDDQGYMTVL